MGYRAVRSTVEEAMGYRAVRSTVEEAVEYRAVCSTEEEAVDIEFLQMHGYYHCNVSFSCGKVSFRTYVFCYVVNSHFLLYYILVQGGGGNGREIGLKV